MNLCIGFSALSPEVAHLNRLHRSILTRTDLLNKSTLPWQMFEHRCQGQTLKFFNSEHTRLLGRQANPCRRYLLRQICLTSTDPSLVYDVAYWADLSCGFWARVHMDTCIRGYPSTRAASQMCQSKRLQQRLVTHPSRWECLAQKQVAHAHAHTHIREWERKRQTIANVYRLCCIFSSQFLVIVRNRVGTKGRQNWVDAKPDRNVGIGIIYFLLYMKQNWRFHSKISKDCWIRSILKVRKINIQKLYNKNKTNENVFLKESLNRKRSALILGGKIYKWQVLTASFLYSTRFFSGSQIPMRRDPL